MATMADRYAIVRSVHHKEAPIHETGHQMMQTGRLFRGGQEYPHYGAVLSQLRGPRAEGVPPFGVLPGPIGNTGVSVSHGQGAGYLGVAHEPFFLRADPARLRPDARRRGRRATGPRRGRRLDNPMLRRRSSRRGPRRRVDLDRERLPATATAATPSASRACWPGGWSSTASGW